MDIVYDLLGAIIGSWIVFNLFCIILFKVLDSKSLRYVSFVGSAIVILVITNFTIGMQIGFLMYIPALFIWFVLDLVKLNKNNSKTEEAPTQ